MIEWEPRTLLTGSKVVIKGTHLDDDGDPEDITGREFGLWIYPEDHPELATEYGNGIFTITSAADGEYRAVIPRADTQEYEAGRRVVEIWFTDNDSDDPIAMGAFDFIETGRPDD